MATFQITYKERFHPSLVRADLNALAQLTAGSFTHDGGSKGSVTCPDGFAWLINDSTREMVKSLTRKV